MLSLITILVLGFLLGMRHATDPDHVIAVTTIVSKERGVANAGLIGALWGLGHTLTIFLVGAAIILFKITIPPRVGLSMEFTVGLMLILLGVLNLTGVLRWLQSFTLREVPDVTRDNNCVHLPLPMCGGLGLYNVVRPLVIGIVHGLAGSAAVALLVMATIRDPWGAIAYLLLFGAGTVAGMMLITAVIAVPFVYTSRRFSGWNRKMGVASGLVSVSFGLFLSYQTTIVAGLFTNHARWMPH
jgi:high-affinity nickel permease